MEAKEIVEIMPYLFVVCGGISAALLWGVKWLSSKIGTADPLSENYRREIAEINTLGKSESK